MKDEGGCFKIKIKGTEGTKKWKNDKDEGGPLHIRRGSTYKI